MCFLFCLCALGACAKFLLLFDNLPMNCKTICLYFGHQFLLNYLMFVGCLAFVGCLVFFALMCFVIQQMFTTM